MRGLAAALVALAEPAAGQGSDALMAERERLAREADAATRRQGQLQLKAAAS